MHMNQRRVRAQDLQQQLILFSHSRPENAAQMFLFQCFARPHENVSPKVEVSEQSTSGNDPMQFVFFPTETLGFQHIY